MKELIDFAADVATTWAQENAKTYAGDPEGFAKAVCKIVRQIAPTLTEGYGAGEDQPGPDKGELPPVHIAGDRPKPKRFLYQTSGQKYGITLSVHHNDLPQGIGIQDVVHLIEQFLAAAHRVRGPHGIEYLQPDLLIESEGGKESITLAGKIWDSAQRKMVPWAMEHRTVAVS